MEVFLLQFCEKDEDYGIVTRKVSFTLIWKTDSYDHYFLFDF